MIVLILENLLMRRQWCLRRQTTRTPMVNSAGIEHITCCSSGHRPMMMSQLQLSLRRTLMRIALYLRVSTSNQRQAQTIDQQLDHLQHALEERQWTVAQAHIFRDDPALQFPLLTRIYKVASKGPQHAVKAGRKRKRCSLRPASSA